MTSFLRSDRSTPVAIWLLVVAALVLAMVVVGGATRLTDSGLSITEWKPVTGALPPLSQQDWALEFARYKEIPQYQQVNRGMSLANSRRSTGGNGRTGSWGGWWGRCSPCRSLTS